LDNTRVGYYRNTTIKCQYICFYAKIVA